MAVARYSIQGLDPQNNHLSMVRNLLEGDFERFIIYSAFLKKSACEDIEDELKKHDGDITILVGIRNNITSKQALEILLKTGATIYAVDTGSTTQIFHPKTYVGINNAIKKAEVIIGSANMTPGGFLNNVENSAFLSLDLDNSDDKAFVDSFMYGFNALIKDFSDENVILVDSVDIIDTLFKQGRVVDESIRRVASVGSSRGEDETVKRMPLRVGKHKKKEEPVTSDSEKAIGEAIVVSHGFGGKIKEVWKSKPLNERDLTIPSAKGTNPTGSMLMKKGAYNVDQQSYFRDEVFSGLNWGMKPGKPKYFEFSNAEFLFIIDGVEYGPYNLMIKYDSRTNTTSYKQKQPNVHLSWGDAKNIIKNTNLLGKILYLYSVDGYKDKFVIEIKDE